MIKGIIFDWFGVCTVENWRDVLARELSGKLNIEESFVQEKFKPLIQPFARAEWTPEQFLKKFIGSLDEKRDYRDFFYLFETLPKVNFELLEYILHLKKHYHIFLLSNNFGPVFPNYEKQVDFNKYFDKLFLSHQLKISKTQEEIWGRVLSEIKLKPNELVFVDNTEKYLKPAKQLDITTVLFLNNNQLKSELTRLKIKY
ncbi:HAD-IA family hydrolase [Candidatus Woesearchaeota archaeon]|nr:HAD-IA family hydrolase [Candidatus Woesearchaeota archaeon]